MSAIVCNMDVSTRLTPCQLSLKSAKKDPFSHYQPIISNVINSLSQWTSTFPILMTIMRPLPPAPLPSGAELSPLIVPNCERVKYVIYMDEEMAQPSDEQLRLAGAAGE